MKRVLFIQQSTFPFHIILYIIIYYTNVGFCPIFNQLASCKKISIKIIRFMFYIFILISNEYCNLIFRTMLNLKKLRMLQKFLLLPEEVFITIHVIIHVQNL